MPNVVTLRMLASEYNVEYVDLDHFNLDRSMASLLTEEFARRYKIVPIGKKFGAPVIAVADPADVFMMEELKSTISREFVTVVADSQQIAEYQDRAYSGDFGADSEDEVPVGLASDGGDDFDDPLATALDSALGSSIFAMAFAPEVEEDAEEDAEEDMLESADGDIDGASLTLENIEDIHIDPAWNGYDTAMDLAAGAAIAIEGVAAEGNGTMESATLEVARNGKLPEEALETIGAGADIGADGVDGIDGLGLDGPGLNGIDGAAGTDIIDIASWGRGATPGGSGPAEAPETEGHGETSGGESETAREAQGGTGSRGRAKHATGATTGGAGEEAADTGGQADGVKTAEIETAGAGDVGDTKAEDTGETEIGRAQSVEAEITEAGDTGANDTRRSRSSRAAKAARARAADGKGSAAGTGIDAEVDFGEAMPQEPSPEQSQEDAAPKKSVVGATRRGKGKSAEEATAEESASQGGAHSDKPAVAAEAEAELVGDAGEERRGGVFDEALLNLVEEIVPGTEGGAAGDIASFPPLARVLVEGGRVKLDDMVSVLAEHDATGQTIARVLTGRGLATESDLMWGLAQEMGLEFVDLDLIQIDINLAVKIPDSTARHHNILLVDYQEGKYVVAMSNPTDVFATDDIRSILGRNLKTVVATKSQISRHLERCYTHGGSTEVAAQRAAVDVMGDTEQAPQRETEIQSVTEDAPVVRYVNLLILQALNERASDIHIEPTHDSLRIRYRIDGVLHDMQQAPLSLLSAVTTRLKVMGDLNVAEHRVPQDGRISVSVGGRTIDLRIATIPTVYGEKVVMRVLDKSEVVLDLEKLGCEPSFIEQYRSVFKRPYGTIFVTGPTGSGKTTTLYATLSELNSPEKNIITVEDPVELRIAGVNQVQTNTKAGLTFASALRSMLRCDPDIVMVGEIRDRETALISVEAALTGHLVLATMHTNDSSRTPMRLIEMGIEGYLVASAMTAVVAQRLVRQLCVHCKEAFEPSEAEIVGAGWKPDDVYSRTIDGKVTVYRPIGCPACSKTGYRGREAIYELMVADDELERMVTSGASAEQIQDMAIQKGMTTLKHAGLDKVLKGETTLEEVLRVVA
ncbi:MAG: GspE/PulE family protein [Acidimicrobiales bacterium]